MTEDEILDRLRELTNKPVLTVDDRNEKNRLQQGLFILGLSSLEV